MWHSSTTAIATSIFFLLFQPSLSLLAAPSFSNVRSFPTTTNLQLNMVKEIKEIQTANAPAPVGPYSQAILVGTTLYCSGQIALDPVSGDMVGGGDVQEEAKQALKNLGEVLKAAGTDASRVVRCTVFLADLADFARANEIYVEFFKDSPVAPTRSCVQAAALPKGAQFEIDCIAEL